MVWNTGVFLRSPEVPGLWPSKGVVAMVSIMRSPFRRLEASPRGCARRRGRGRVSHRPPQGAAMIRRSSCHFRSAGPRLRGSAQSRARRSSVAPSISAVTGENCRPGAEARGERHLVGVDDGVGEAADARDDGQGAIAQGAELGQAARLEAGGNRAARPRPPGFDARPSRRSRSSRRPVPAAPPQPRAAPVRARVRPRQAPRAARRCRSRTSRLAMTRSWPFCHESRLTTPRSSAPGSGSRPNFRCRNALLAGRCASVARLNGSSISRRRRDPKRPRRSPLRMPLTAMPRARSSPSRPMP